MPLVPLAELTALATRALRRAGAAESMARATAHALVHADACGLPSHGLSRLALYCEHLASGRADGAAVATVAHETRACCLIDAGGGLAYEALALAGRQAIARARRFGIAYVGVRRSHHAGAMAYHLEPIAAAGLVGLAFTNSPAAINAWGGRGPLFGTNPIAAIFPRRERSPLVVDLSLTEVVRGKIMLHAQEGKPIPLGWALDRDGKPTTDARAALTGSLSAIGGVKGASLALVVELLCCALTGAAFGFENDSYFEPGGRADIGHALIAIDPGALAGTDTFAERLESLLATMTADADVRLPGERRAAALAHARAEGIAIDDGLLARIAGLAGA